jgi:hypothetical protein
MLRNNPLKADKGWSLLPCLIAGVRYVVGISEKIDPGTLDENSVGVGNDVRINPLEATREPSISSAR